MSTPVSQGSVGSDSHIKSAVFAGSTVRHNPTPEEDALEEDQVVGECLCSLGYLCIMHIDSANEDYTNDSSWKE